MHVNQKNKLIELSHELLNFGRDVSSNNEGNTEFNIGVAAQLMGQALVCMHRSISLGNSRESRAEEREMSSRLLKNASDQLK